MSARPLNDFRAGFWGCLLLRRVFLRRPRYCGDPDGVHDDEIIRSEDAWSFGRSPIAPLLAAPLCAVAPWPAVPWPAVPAPVLVPVEPDDPAVLPVPDVAPLDDVPPPGLVLPVPDVPELLMPWPLVPEWLPESRRPWIST